MSTGLQQ